MYTNRSDNLKYSILLYTSQRFSIIIMFQADQKHFNYLIRLLQPIMLDKNYLKAILFMFSDLIESQDGLIDILIFNILISRQIMSLFFFFNRVCTESQ